MTLTHFAEDTSSLQDEVELGATGDLAGALCCLQRFRLQLRKEQGQTWVIVVRVANLGYLSIYDRCYIFQWILRSMMSTEHWIRCRWSKPTTKIRTARSRRRSSQNAQLASHLFPSLKAKGMTVPVKMSRKMGPSSPSTTRASATASCQSPTFFKSTLTASFRLPPKRKNAAAYSVVRG